MRKLHAMALGVTLAAALGIGCSDSTTSPPNPPPVASVTLSRDTATMAIGESVQLTAILRDAQGATLDGRTIAWASTAPGTASVSNNGLVTATALGQSKIVATAEGKSDTTTVTVRAAPVASLTLTRDSATVEIGGTIQFSVTLKDAQGTVLTGRDVAWTSTAPATASVSTTGLVTATALGQSKIVATAEGKSDTATVSVPPARVIVTLAPGTSKTATIGAAGGTIQATDARGTRYTLTVPALALMAPVAITVTPLDTVAGLPLSGGFVAGADLKPAGLQFALPATLTIVTNAQPSGNQRLVGLTYEGTGDSLALTAAKRQSNTITIAVSHFSGVIAGFGTTQDVERLFLSVTPPLTSANQIAAEILLVLSSQTPRDGAAELQVMEGWFDLLVLPELTRATTDAQLVAAIDEYEKWRHLFPDMMGVYLNIPGGENAPSLVQRRSQWEQAFAAKVKAAIAANKQLCAAPGLTSGRVAALNNALFWHRIARDLYFVATPQNGLDLPAFRNGLCATGISQNLAFPNPLVEGQAQNLDVTFALRFTDGVVLPSDFVVKTTGTGANLQFPGATAATPPGFFTGVVTPTGGAVTLNLTACYAGGGLGALIADEICHSVSLVRNVEPALHIDTSTLPSGSVGTSYAATLQASGGDGTYVWSIGSGQLPPGLSLNSSTGTISGTPISGGTFGFGATVTSQTQSDVRGLQIQIAGSAPPPPPTGGCPDVVLEFNAQVLAAANLTCAKNLRISGFNNNITIPVNLSQLTTVEEAFLVEENIPSLLLGSLTQHSGLVNGLTFRNPALTSIDLSAVRTGGGISIGNALNLQSVVIGGSVDLRGPGGGISINNAPSLTSFTIGGGSIAVDLLIDGTGLTNLNGIPCGFRVGRNLLIINNTNLSTAVAQAKANCLLVSGSVSIFGNKVP
jgi:hypothetical protein